MNPSKTLKTLRGRRKDLLAQAGVSGCSVQRRRALAAWLVSGVALAGWAPAPALAADAVQQLRDFVREVRSGRAAFTQTVVSVDGARRRVSTGTFEFQRPDRFRFDYAKPFEQLIVADGRKVWIHDPDLNQASSRALDQAIGSTPAALLAGGSIETEFALQPERSAEGIDWVRATPRKPGGTVQAMRVGFRGGVLAALEIEDSFGQRSLLRFERFEANAVLAAERFRFQPPPGVDIIAQ